MSRPWQVLAGMQPPPLQADQRQARRKALLGEQAQELTIERIRQEIAESKAAAAEHQRNLQTTDQVRAIRQKGGDPQAIYSELLAADPAEAEKFRAAANAESQMLNPEGQQTPEFTAPLQTQQAPLPELGAGDVLEQGTPVPQTIGEQTVAMPAPSARVIDLGGNAREIMRRSASQIRKQAEADLLKKQKIETDENIRQAKETATAKPPLEIASFGTDGLYNKTTGEILRQPTPKPEVTDKTITAFEEWRKDNPKEPIKTWIDLNKTDKGSNEPLVPTSDEFGNTVYTPRSQAAGLKVPTSSQNKPPTSAERKMLGFYERVSNSLDKIDGMESDISKMDLFDQARLKLAPNIFQTAVGKRFTQAANDFINASLRRESGAAISDGEYKRFQQIYFPMPGDDAATLTQKKKARDVQLETFKTESGKAFSEKYGDEQKPNGSTAAPDGKIEEYERGPDGKLRKKAK